MTNPLKYFFANKRELLTINYFMKVFRDLPLSILPADASDVSDRVTVLRILQGVLCKWLCTLRLDKVVKKSRSVSLCSSSIIVVLHGLLL